MHVFDYDQYHTDVLTCYAKQHAVVCALVECEVHQKKRSHMHCMTAGCSEDYLGPVLLGADFIAPEKGQASFHCLVAVRIAPLKLAFFSVLVQYQSFADSCEENACGDSSGTVLPLTNI